MEETTRIATRLLGHIRSDLLETGESFGLDSDLFAAGLESMSILHWLTLPRPSGRRSGWDDAYREKVLFGRVL